MTTSAPVLAFDIGGSNLRVGVVEGDVVRATRTVPSGKAPPEEIAARAATVARELEASLAVRARGAGVGLAAMVPLPGDVVENAPNLGWRDAPFRALLSRALDDRPVLIVNDLDAITLGERAAGAARGHDDVLCVFVGTGVGAGIVVDGRLVRGARGVAAELGHIKVHAGGGRRCGCGASGCLEAYAGGGPLLDRVRALVDDGAAPAIAARAAAAGPLTLSTVDALAKEGEPVASALWDEVAILLGLALANAITVLNPSILVVGGGVWTRCHELAARASRVMHEATNAPATKGLVVREAVLGDDAGLLGAAAAFLAHAS